MEEDETKITLPTEKIRNLKTAIDELEGLPIPYNIIKHHIEPLREWCIQMLEEDGVKNEEKEVK